MRLLLVLVILAAGVLTASSALAYNCTSGDNLQKGQMKIDQGKYTEAIDVFTCVITASPTTVDAYRGRSEAKLLLGRFSDAYRDMYALAIAATQPSNIVTLGDTIIASYDTRLNNDPWNVPALTGGAFARWCYWGYADAIPLLGQLLLLNPNNVYANLFRGSNRLFAGIDVAAGQADIEKAITLAPTSADVRYVTADAYTYALPDLNRAYTEASYALSWGLNTPRVHAILATALNAAGDLAGAAAHIRTHITQSTVQTSNTTALAVGSTKRVPLSPWNTYQIPIQATAGQAIHITTSSPSANLWDSIIVLLNPKGVPVIGSDDYIDFFAGFDWVPPTSGTYTLQVTSFEGIMTGPLDVTRN